MTTHPTLPPSAGSTRPAESLRRLSVGGARSGSSLRLAAELRQLGGALDRPHPDGGAMPRLHGQFTFFCGAPVTDVDAGTRGAADVARTVGASGSYAVLGSPRWTRTGCSSRTMRCLQSPYDDHARR